MAKSVTTSSKQTSNKVASKSLQAESHKKMVNKSAQSKPMPSKSNNSKTNNTNSVAQKKEGGKFHIGDKIKKWFTFGAVSICLVLIMTLSVVLPVVLKKKKDTPFQAPALNLPIEERYALQSYNYSNLSNTAVTLRADIMNVISRNIPRQNPEILGNEFAIIYDSSSKTLSTFYGEEGNSAEFSQYIKDSNAATIKFTDYPSPSHGVSGTGAFVDGSTGNTAITSSDFYKYMLMTQGQHLAMEAQQRSKDGSLSSWLKKHPAADAQYGEVIGDAVVKEIIMDPIYRSFHATGLYLPAGEVVKVKVEGLAPGERIAVTINLHNSLAWRGSATDSVYNSLVQGSVNIQSVDAYFTKADVITANGQFVGNVTNQSQWARQNNRAPWIIADFTFDSDGEYEIGTPFGGVMHINPMNCYSNVKTTFTGAVETPHYILGVTTPEYFEDHLKDAPGVIAVLDTENGQLVSPTGEAGTTTYMRGVKTEEIDKLASLWHTFFAVNESFTGGTYNRNNIVKFDLHVPAGAAVALGGYVYACPTSWFGSAMNYQGLLASGTWGILHEIGHNHSSAYGSVWGFGDSREGEVRNNALTLLAYIKFCDVGTTVRNGGSAEHGEYADPFKTLGETLNYLNQSHTDFGDGTYGYFQMLGMYSNIMHSFGADKFYELLYSYKENPVYSYVDRNITNAIRADFNYRCSIIYGMNFTKYFNTFYKANIKTSVYSAEQLAYMNSLPNYEPVANKYAGGIDGVKTSGDYKVTFGENLVFDLKSTTISTLDTSDKKGFEVISISNAKYGVVTDFGDGRCVYTFSKNYAGALDQFSFKVRLSDGVIHELTIYLRISYPNNSKLTVYEPFDALDGGLTNETWGNVLNKLGTVSSTTSNSDSYVHYFGTNDGKWSVETLEYYWKAPETGYITFHVQRDDGLIFYFGNDFNSLELQDYYNGRSTIWSDAGAEGKKYYVEKDHYYAVKLVSIDVGNGTGNGRGFSFLGYKYESGKITLIPNNQIYHPSYPIDQEIETYVFTPTFMVSKKDSIKISTAGTDKNAWSVIEAPDIYHDDKTNTDKNLIHDGRIDVITRYETEKDADGNPTGVITSYKIEIDKWSYLIDGDVGTVLHTTYGDKSIPYPTESEPYKFVIDTGKVQQFNYFSVITRTSAINVSKITKYELQISNNNRDWHTISEGDQLEYNKNVATIKFDSVSGRYLRLLVKGTTGNRGQFVVIAELDAGITSTTQRIVPATSNFLFTTSGWKNTSLIDEEQSGYMMASSKNEKLVFRFNGESLAVYAAVGEGYGTADVKLDGKFVQTVDFSSSVHEARKLVLDFENLEDEVHTLEIITKSSEKVMINLFGISYTAELVNAPNIYLEKALTISLIVFVILFVLAFALLLCLLFIPKFRKLMGNNKAIAWLDKSIEEQREKNKIKRAEKKKAKQLAKENENKENNVKSVAKKSASVKADKKEKIDVKPAKVDSSKTNKTKPQQETKKTVTDKKQATINAKSKSAQLNNKLVETQTKTKPVAKEKAVTKAVAEKSKPETKAKTQNTQASKTQTKPAASSSKSQTQKIAQTKKTGSKK